MTKRKQIKEMQYTLCKHFEGLPEKLRPSLSFACPYCPVCGQKLVQERWVMKDICGKCNKPVTGVGGLNNNYCIFCGEKL